MFLAGRLSYNDEKVTGSHVEEAIKGVFNPDGSVSTEKIEIEKIIDKTNKTVKLSAKAKLAGRSTVLPMWTYKDSPGATGDEVRTYNHEIVGVVRAWTLAGALASEKIKTWRQEVKKEKKAEKKKTIEGSVKSGKDQMDTDDF